MGGHRGTLASALTLALVIFVHGASCEDLVTGSVSESSNPQSGVQSMPDSVSLNVTVGGQGVHLELQVDQSVDRDVPVFILSSNENGELETRRVTLNKTEDFAIYHDVTQGAAFSARRSVDEDGQSYLSLEGILQVEGKMYDLKSTGRRNQNSSEDTTDRKDSPPENSVTHAPGHNVQRRDVSGEEAAKSGQNEAGEDHEFVVHLRDDLLPGGQRGDAVVAPPTVTRTIEMRDLTGNKLPPPPAAAPPPVRKRRQSSKQNIYIDVVAVVDYRVFSDWYARSSAANKTQDAIVSIRQYYAFVYSGINMLYEGISSSLYSFHVKLSAIVIATTAGASTWTESLRQTASPRDIVNTNQVLAKFSDWVSNPNTTLPSYDHLTLFSGYEFIKVDGTTLIASDAITGLAYLSSLCLTDGKSSSVVEDHGGFRCMFTAAHELGHSLSAEHDGNENACSASDQYIMTSTSSVATATNKLNLWRFSSCSINYFNTFISNKLTTPRGQQCLYNNLTSSNIPDVSSQQPGQVYDHDAQCRQTYGPSSVMCRGIEFYNTPADICTIMFCNDGTTGNQCAAAIAARGTSCGNKKWCVNGQCVYDIQAPSLDDNCPFGDQPGLVFNNQTCAQLVSGYPPYCYDNVVLSRCCRSCANYYTGLQNCLYGDKVTGCSQLYCSRGGTNYLSSCCGTCKYGTPITTSSTTSPDVTSSSSFSTTTTTSTVMTTVVSTTTLPTTPTTSTSTLLPTTTTATTLPSTSSTSASKTTTTATQNPAGAAATTALPTSPTTLTSTLLTTTTTATIPSTSASKTTKTVTQNPDGAATTTTLLTSPTKLTSTLLATTTTTILSTSSTSALKSSTTVTQNPAGAATTTTTQTADTCLDEETYSSVCSTLTRTSSGCYNNTVRQHCCATCNSLSESTETGCKSSNQLGCINGAPPVYSSSLRTVHLMCVLCLLWNSSFLLQRLFYSL